MKKVIINSIAIFIFSASIFAQEETSRDTLRIELKDGSTLVGTILKEDSLFVYFTTLSNIQTVIPHIQIRWKTKAFTQEETVEDTVSNNIDPNNSRLFLMPTGRPLGLGRGYFASHELFFPSLAFGITNFLSLSGGASILPGSSSQLMYFSPKVTLINTEKFSLSAGTTLMNSTSNDLFEKSALTYGVATFGSQSFSITIGLGRSELGNNNTQLIFGGELRVSKSVKLISENWFWANEGIAFFGIRFLGKNVSSDFGFVRPTGDPGSGFRFLPWIVVAYNFGPSLKNIFYTPETIERFEKTPYRFSVSYDLGTAKGNDGAREMLSSNGFHFYGSNPFFSNSEHSKTGSGITVQGERIVSSRSALGITISTIGVFAGTPSSLDAFRYTYNFTDNYYYSSYVRHEFTTISALIHYSYTIGDTSVSSHVYGTMGCGAGVSRVGSQWMANANGFSNFPKDNTPVRYENTPTGMIHGSLEQRLFQYISFGVHASYYFLVPIKNSKATLRTGSRWTFGVEPQEIPLYTEIPASKINYSYGKISLALAIHF